MKNTIKISCILDTTDPTAELSFEAWVDNQKFFDVDHVQVQQQIVIEIPDNDGEHELRLVMKNKTFNHTQIDESGNIVADARLIITDVAFDEIKPGQHIVTELSTYTHDFNGTKELMQDKFYGEMGCNGTVNLKFTAPVYIWLLEHM